MNKKRWLILCLVLVAAVAAWRLWPRSMESLLGRPLEEADQVTCNLRISSWENEGSVNDVYLLSAETPEESQAVLDILRGGKCRVSFMSLLPWTWGSLHAGGGYDGRFIILTLLFNGEEPDSVTMIFYGNDKGSVEGRQVYPIGNEMFDKLAEYIQSNGTLQPEASSGSGS